MAYRGRRKTAEVSCINIDHSSEMVTSFETLMTCHSFTDLTFVCGNGIVLAHKAIVLPLSSWLREVVASVEALQSKATEVHISLPDVEKATLLSLLYYAYKGEVNLRSKEMQIKFNALLKTLGIQDHHKAMVDDSPPPEKKSKISLSKDLNVANGKPCPKKSNGKASKNDVKSEASETDVKIITASSRSDSSCSLNADYEKACLAAKCKRVFVKLVPLAGSRGSLSSVPPSENRAATPAHVSFTTPSAATPSTRRHTRNPLPISSMQDHEGRHETNSSPSNNVAKKNCRTRNSHPPTQAEDYDKAYQEAKCRQVSVNLVPVANPSLGLYPAASSNNDVETLSNSRTPSVALTEDHRARRSFPSTGVKNTKARRTTPSSVPTQRATKRKRIDNVTDVCDSMPSTNGVNGGGTINKSVGEERSLIVGIIGKRIRNGVVEYMAKMQDEVEAVWIDSSLLSTSEALVNEFELRIENSRKKERGTVILSEDTEDEAKRDNIERLQSDEESYNPKICEQCMRIFVSPDAFLDHQAKHHEENPNAPEMIEEQNGDELVENPSTSNRNVVGTDKKTSSVVCAHCETDVAQNTYRAHILSHFQSELSQDLPSQKPFRCPRCPKTMVNVKTLMYHYAFVHEAIYRYISRDEHHEKDVSANEISVENRESTDSVAESFAGYNNMPSVVFSTFHNAAK